MFSHDFLNKCKLYELKQQMIPCEEEKQEIHLTAEQLNKFNQVLQSIKLNRSESTNKIFKDVKLIIQNCDVTKPESREKLLHLSHIILNNFSSKSIDWILTIYQRIMNCSVNLPSTDSSKNYHKLINLLLKTYQQKSISDSMQRYTCVDLVKQASLSENLATSVSMLNC